MRRKSNSKLHGILGAMDAHERRNAPQMMICQRCNGTGWEYAEDCEQGYHLSYKTQCQSCHGTGEPPQEPPQDSAVCALADCDEPAAYTCVCCNRKVCQPHIDMADGWPSLCPDCLMGCQFAYACQVVTK